MAIPALNTLRSKVSELEETEIIQVLLHGIENPGIIGLWAGEGDLPTPELIYQPTIDALHAGETFYTHQRGLPEARDAIANYMNRTFQTDIDEDRVSLLPSGMAALFHAIQMLIDEGDEIVVLGPVWPNIYSLIHMFGGKVKHVSLEQKESGWELDLDKLLSAISDRTRAVFVNTPSNPTGWLMERDAQQALLQHCRDLGVWIIADEVYHQLVFDRPVAPSFLQIAEPDDLLFIVNSMSKSWLMTGWRIGWLTHPPGFGDTIAKMVQIVSTGIPQFTQRSAIKAFDDGDQIIQDMRKRIQAGRDLVFDRLEAWPKVRAMRPPASFYAFFTVDGMGGSLDYAKELVDRCNVGLAPGSAFGPDGEGYLRLCYASTTDTLEEAMRRLEPVLGEGSDQGH